MITLHEADSSLLTYRTAPRELKKHESLHTSTHWAIRRVSFLPLSDILTYRSNICLKVQYLLPTSSSTHSEFTWLCKCYIKGFIRIFLEQKSVIWNQADQNLVINSELSVVNDSNQMKHLSWPNQWFLCRCDFSPSLLFLIVRVRLGLDFPRNLSKTSLLSLSTFTLENFQTKPISGDSLSIIFRF